MNFDLIDQIQPRSAGTGGGAGTAGPIAAVRWTLPQDAHGIGPTPDHERKPKMSDIEHSDWTTPASNRPAS